MKSYDKTSYLILKQRPGGFGGIQFEIQASVAGLWAALYLEPHSLTWINFNPSNYIHYIFYVS